MTEADVKAALIKVIAEIQEKSGLQCPDLKGTIKPLADVPQFDSKIGAAAASKLAKALQIDIPPSTNIFVEKDAKTNLSIDEVASLILKISKPRAKDAA